MISFAKLGVIFYNSDFAIRNFAIFNRILLQQANKKHKKIKKKVENDEHLKKVFNFIVNLSNNSEINEKIAENIEIIWQCEQIKNVCKFAYRPRGKG